MANIFEILSKDGNITPEKARKSRQMKFRDKTAYVWGLCYRWDPLLSRNPVPRFPHFMLPCHWLRASGWTWTTGYDRSSGTFLSILRQAKSVVSIVFYKYVKNQWPIFVSCQQVAQILSFTSMSFVYVSILTLVMEVGQPIDMYILKNI